MMELSEEDVMLMELALLFRIPLYRLLNEMPYEEYIAWMYYLKDHPVERAADYRAAMIMSAFGGKAPITKIFPSLQTATGAGTIGKKLEGSVFLSKMNSAVGGIRLKA